MLTGCNFVPGEAPIQHYSLVCSDLADDTVLLAENEEDLQTLLDGVKEKSEENGLKINISKTKTIVFSKEAVPPTSNIYIDNRKLDQVQHVDYLGHRLTSDGRNDTDVKRRIGIPKTNFQKMSSITTNRKLKISTRLRLSSCYILTSFLYASETGTHISSKLESNINALEAPSKDTQNTLDEENIQ